MADYHLLNIFFEKSWRKVWTVSKKSVPLHSQFRNEVAKTLGYGVMVTLQILVLSFLVRVRVPQHERAEQDSCLALLFFITIQV